jgi:hypothetical protein
MENDSMSYRLLESCGSAVHHGNRQDAREGGEIPPLPRNCERPCLDARRIGLSNEGRISARVVSPCAKARETTGSESRLRARFWEGG